MKRKLHLNDDSVTIDPGLSLEIPSVGGKPPDDGLTGSASTSMAIQPPQSENLKIHWHVNCT